MAEGAEDGLVKETLYEAVKTVLGISGNKVQIFQVNRGGSMFKVKRPAIIGLLLILLYLLILKLPVHNRP